MVAKKTKKKMATSKKKDINIERFLTYFLIAIICLGLYFNGCFFEHQSLSVNVITALIFLSTLIVLIKQKKCLYYDKKTFYIGLAFLIVNILGIFFASNVRDALQGVVVLFNALLIYLLALVAFNNKEENIRIFLKGFYWTVFSIALISLLAFSIGKNLLNFYPNNSNRLFATLGYPNTAAAILLIGFFVGFYLIEIIERNKYVYWSANSFIFIAFLKAQSRGVLVIFPILILFYILLQKKQKISKAIELFMIVFLSTIAYFISFNDKFSDVSALKFFLYICTMVILIIIYYCYEKIGKKEFKYKKIVAYILLLTFIISIFTIVVFEKDTLLNSTIVKRISSLSTFEKDLSIYSRLIFMKDALKITKENLWLGSGAGGWNAEYKKYRTYLYYTTQVHNHYLQVLIENGILGFALFLILWGLLTYYLLIRFKRNQENKDITTILFLISLTFMLHSFMDFDFTYPVVYYLWWITIAASISKENISTFDVNKKSVSASFGIITLFMLIINGSLLIGNAYGRIAVEFMQKNQLDEAINRLEVSSVFDPVNSFNKVNLSQLYFARGEKEKAIKILESAINNNRTNFEWCIVKTRFLIEMGRYEEAYQVALSAIDRAPFEEVVYYDAARFFFEQENKSAQNYGKKILLLAENEGKKIEGNEFYAWWKGERLNTSPKLSFLKGQIFELEGDYDKASLCYYLAMEEETLKEIAINKLQKMYLKTKNYIVNGEFETGDLSGWTLCGKAGENREIVFLNGESFANISKLNKETSWWGIYQYINDFIPGQEYQLSFKAFSKNENGKIRLILHQVGEDNNPQKNKTIALIKENKTYNWTFKTDDLKNKNGLRVYFLVPNSPEKQDVCIGNVKLEKVERIEQ